jgi:hypothetical protein
MAIVEVRPIEKERWHNKKGKDSFKRPVTIEALIDVNTGQFATGLSTEDRERLEKATGQNLSPDYMVGKPHEFWNSPAAAIKLEYKTNIFDTKKAFDEIKVKVLKASDLVANSMKEYEEGKFPNAIFVIFDETEEVERKASKAAIKRKVVIESSKLTKSRKAEIVQILSGVSVKNQTEDYIDLKLDEEIEDKGPDKVLAIIQRDKARTSLHALVLEAIQKNVLRKEGTAVYYMDDQVGFDLESAIDYFADSKNQALKAQILEKINE